MTFGNMRELGLCGLNVLGSSGDQESADEVIE
jgi:hypothetical protein